MVRTVYTYPFDIPKTHCKAIGEVISKMALAEFQVMQLIGYLLGIKDPKKLRISFMGMSMKARLGAVKALATYWSPTPSIKSEIHSIVSELRKLAPVRNSFAHGQWGFSTNRRKLSIVFAEESKDFFLPKAKHYKSAHIVAKAIEARAIVKRLKHVCDSLKGAQTP